MVSHKAIPRLSHKSDGLLMQKNDWHENIADQVYQFSQELVELDPSEATTMIASTILAGIVLQANGLIDYALEPDEDTEIFIRQWLGTVLCKFQESCPDLIQET